MIFIEDIISLLKKKKIDFFTGVPDSILKNLIYKFKKNHISVNNEGTAVSLASGAEAQFTITNSATQLNSLILLTVDSPAVGASTDDSVVIAQVTGKADGSFKVILKNVGDSATDTNARKINFLIINPGV